MNTATHTLQQLVALRDSIDLAIEVIHQCHIAPDTVTADDVTLAITRVNNTWEDFSLNLVPEYTLDAQTIIRMLGLNPVTESVPEQTRGGFTVIPGGLA